MIMSIIIIIHIIPPPLRGRGPRLARAAPPQLPEVL